MASAATKAAAVSVGGSARRSTRTGHDAATAAWLCALPCTAIVAAAILLLGPPLGRLLVPAPGTYAFLPEELPFIRPEPTEHARFLLALTAPLLAALAVALSARWQPRVPARVAELATAATQTALVGVVVAACVAQRRIVFGAQYNGGQRPFHLIYFTNATLVVAGVLAGGAAAVATNGRLRGRAAALLRESRSRRWIALVIAVVATIAWTLPAVQSDATIARAPTDLFYHLQFPYDETFAVLNGRTPLVDFTAQYSSLWPFVNALSMILFGKTLLTFSITMTAIGTLSLLAVFGVFRRVTHSSVAALALYLPFLASLLFLIGDSLVNRSTVGTYLGTFPLRYAAPWFVAYLTARLLAQRGVPAHRSLWLLFTVAGLALLNNGDFGVAATVASVAALLWTMAAQPERRAALVRLAGGVVAGLASAFALVSLLTLVRAGSLPQPARLVDYARLYGIGSFALSPMPGPLGTHLLIYLTYVAAIVVATVRSVTRAANRVLTGMLAWAGVFGLGAGTYYVGRSHPVALKHHFGAWSFTLALLSVVVIGALANRPLRRTLVAGVVVLFGFGVMACSLAQLPRPWSEVDRLTTPYASLEPWGSTKPFTPPADEASRAFVTTLADGPNRFVYRHGAPVALLLTDGHRIADAYGIVNVSPYTGIQSLQTVQRVEATLDALRDAGGNTVILPSIPEPGLYAVLDRRGFEVLTAGGGLAPYVEGRTVPATQQWPVVGSVMKWVDAHRLHPRALQ